jgi:hypothetical protein
LHLEINYFSFSSESPETEAAAMLPALPRSDSP